MHSVVSETKASEDIVNLAQDTTMERNTHIKDEAGPAETPIATLPSEASRRFGWVQFESLKESSTVWARTARSMHVK